MTTFYSLIFLTILTLTTVKNSIPSTNQAILPKKTILSSITQVTALSSPNAQGFLDRLTFATPESGGNGTGTSFIPFSISGNDLTHTNDNCNSIALQPDGCILLNGSTVATNGNTYFSLARYLPNGELDPTFGQTGTPRAGTTYIPFSIAGGGNDDESYSIALQPDGKIVIGGYTYNGTAYYFALARFTPTGILDTTFNPTGAHPGTTYIPFSIAGGGNDDESYSITLQPDGKIVIGGYTYNGAAYYFALARFTSTGILDTTFNPTRAHPGTTYIPFSITGGGNDDASYSIALQSNGKILLAGYSDNGGGYYFALARFTSTGILDTTFNPTGAHPGTTYIPFSIADGGVQDIAFSIALQLDGNIILSGKSNNHFALARFTSTGILDTSFNQNGAHPGTNYVHFFIAGGTADFYNNCALQPDGKILLGGTSNKQFALARFMPNGILDTATFGNVGSSKAGTTYIPFSISGQTLGDYANGIAIQPNGNIFLAGLTSNNNANPAYFAIAKFVN